MHLAHIIQHIGLQMLDIVDLAELQAAIRGFELVKLFESLLSQVVPVDKEQDTLGFGMLDETINEINSCIGLAAARCHLNEGLEDDCSVKDCSRLLIASI